MAQLRAKQIKLVTDGDLLIGGTGGNGAVLAKGTAGTVLKVLTGGALGYEKVIAADTTFAPAGTIAAVTVQAAIEEVATDAAAALALVQSELDATQTGAGLGANGAYTAKADSVYLKTATSLKDADNQLDSALNNLKVRVDNLGTGSVSDLQVEVDAIETAIGLNANGTYKPSTNALISAATSALNADELLAAGIAKEATDRATAVTAEHDRALAAEGANTTAITNEVTRATGVEGALRTDLTAETTRATGAEGKLTTDLAAEVTRATAEEARVAGLVATEVTRAKAAEQANTDAIGAEVTRATAAENTLKGRADALETGALAHEAEINLLEGTVGSNPDGSAVAFTNINYIAANDSHYAAINKIDAAAKVIATSVATEATRATGAETALQSELNTTQAGAGLGESGTYTAETVYDAGTNATGVHYIQGATSLKSADKVLDAAIFALKGQVDAISGGGSGTSLSTLQSEVDTLEATLGLGANSDGTMIDYTSINFITARDTFKAAIEKLDGALKGVDTTYKSADANLQQQINSLVGLDALVFKGNFAGNMTAAALTAVTADDGDVYRISSDPSTDFAGRGFDVNVGDFVAKTKDGWVKFDNTDPTLTTTDTALTIGGNTFTGYTLSVNKKSVTSTSTALVVTGGANSTLADVSVALDPSKITFQSLGNVGTPVAGQYLRWSGTALEYVSAGTLGVTVANEEDFTPTTATDASVTLAFPPRGAVAVFINGVKLKKAGFTVVGSTVKLTDANNGYGIETGDTVSVSYNYSA